MAKAWSWDRDWNRDWRRARKALRKDDVLRRIGLEQRSPTGDFFGGLGVFALGILVGAGLGMMFAPKRGEEMRTMMTDAWRSRRARDDMHIGAESATPGMGGGI